MFVKGIKIFLKKKKNKDLQQYCHKRYANLPYHEKQKHSTEKVRKNKK